jgi:hypothetical protein
MTNYSRKEKVLITIMAVEDAARKETLEGPKKLNG